MADGDLMLIQNEDGKFEIYNPEFDITITCKSKEEQEANIKKLKKAFNSLNAWDKVKEEIDGLIKYGDTVAPTEENLATQTAYTFSLHIIEKHLGELQQQEEQE